jgi:hypothetical protein
LEEPNEVEDSLRTLEDCGQALGVDHEPYHSSRGVVGYKGAAWIFCDPRNEGQEDTYGDLEEDLKEITT